MFKNSNRVTRTSSSPKKPIGIFTEEERAFIHKLKQVRGIRADSGLLIPLHSSIKFYDNYCEIAFAVGGTKIYKGKAVDTIRKLLAKYRGELSFSSRYESMILGD